MTPNDQRGVVTAAEAMRLAESQRLTPASLMTALLARAAERARPPISNFYVGAVARGVTTGNLYYGANLEFPLAGLGASVHAEQSAVVNAWVGGERGIDRIAVTAAPCGHCRQFLNEISPSIEIAIEKTASLAELLPHAFGPQSLGSDETLMKERLHQLQTDDTDELAQAALRAASMSYAPYSRSYAGVALRARSGAIYAAPYAENAAFNPSLPPLQGALSLMALAGEAFEEIAEAVLAATDDLHSEQTRMLVATLGCGLRIVRARNS